MRIAYIAAGAGGMYCGSCIHDNAVAAALMRQGHEVALLPTYTPMRTDEASVSEERVFYGALNVYLQQKYPFFRRTHRLLDRLLDRPWLLNRVAKLGASTDATQLGELTLAVLEGEHGPQSKELERLIDWLADEFQPDIVHITNSMFLGLVRRLRERLSVPVVVGVQGEDIFFEQLAEPYRSRVVAEMRRRAADADAFVAPSRYYADHMAQVLDVPSIRFVVVPLGINTEGHGLSVAGQTAAETESQTLGYLARVCPEKGLHLLAEAFRLIARSDAGRSLRLRVAGYLGPRDKPYFHQVQASIKSWGLADRFEYVGEVDLAGKVSFLQSLDVLSVPTTYREAKGLFALEALANGVPVVLPRHGSFPELIEATGGGVLVEPGSAEDLAQGIRQLLADPARRWQLGSQGMSAVHERFNETRMAEATAAVYARLVRQARSA